MIKSKKRPSLQAGKDMSFKHTEESSRDEFLNGSSNEDASSGAHLPSQCLDPHSKKFPCKKDASVVMRSAAATLISSESLKMSTKMSGGP